MSSMTDESSETWGSGRLGYSSSSIVVNISGKVPGLKSVSSYMSKSSGTHSS